MADIRNNLAVVIGCGALFVIAMNVKEAGSADIDSMLWPKVILILMMVLSLCSLITAIVQRRNFREVASAREKVRFRLNKESLMGFLPIIAAFGYVVMIDYMGYFIATLIIIPFLMFLLGEKRFICLASTPALFVLSVWVIFVKLALLMFPMGTGLFRELSQIIMFGS